MGRLFCLHTLKKPGRTLDKKRNRWAEKSAITENSRAIRDILFMEFKGDDRSSVIVRHAAIDDLLGELIRTRLRQDSSATEILIAPEGALGSFSARNNFAYAVGLIGLVLHEDLRLLNDIRRIFAHQVYLHNQHHKIEEITFDSQSIRDKCEKFSRSRGARIYWLKHPEEFAWPSPRSLFGSSMVWIFNHLMREIISGHPAFIIESIHTSDQEYWRNKDSEYEMDVVLGNPEGDYPRFVREIVPKA
jgi:hypothetical protein